MTANVSLKIYRLPSDHLQLRQAIDLHGKFPSQYFEPFHGDHPIMDGRGRRLGAAQRRDDIGQQGMVALEVFIGGRGEIRLPCQRVDIVGQRRQGSSALKGGLRCHRTSITFSTSMRW